MVRREGVVVVVADEGHAHKLALPRLAYGEEYLCMWERAHGRTRARGVCGALARAVHACIESAIVRRRLLVHRPFYALSHKIDWEC